MAEQDKLDAILAKLSSIEAKVDGVEGKLGTLDSEVSRMGADVLSLRGEMKQLRTEGNERHALLVALARKLLASPELRQLGLRPNTYRSSGGGDGLEAAPAMAAAKPEGE